MITHAVLFRWKEGVPAEHVAELAAALDALPGAIPSIRSYHHGPDAGISGTHDYAVVGTFDDVEGWREYDAHPAHQDVRDRLLRPWAADRAVVQFATGG